MKLEIRFGELMGVMKRMGAKPVVWQSRGFVEPANFRQQLDQGIFEIGDLSEVVANAAGELTLRGERILLYIRDTQTDEYTLLHHPERSRRFHVAECSTLDDMRAKQRFSRYVATRRTSGTFTVDATNNETGRIIQVDARLCVCRNCLKTLNYKGYRHHPARQNAIWREFDIADFFASGSDTPFISRPQYTEENYPGTSYAYDWSSISHAVRQKAGWKCDECGVVLEEHKRLLQVHHRNGVKGDNTPENLRPLCVLCHIEMPDHQRMVVPESDRSLIHELRRVQARMRTRT